MFIFLLSPIHSQSGAGYKVFAYKKTCSLVLYSFKREEISFPHEPIFVFIPYFVGMILSKNVVKSGKLGKKI